MLGWSAEQIATGSGARLLGGAAQPPGGPRGVVIDSRAVTGGELFVGLRGEHDDGGAHALQALRAGAWGVLVAPVHAEDSALAERVARNGGVVLAHEDPLAAMQALARAWRRELGSRGARVVAVTGSAGKTSTKDILAALLGGMLRTAASPANHNTEIGLPLAVLAAPPDTEVLVLEMAMRGSGQIAELTALAEPDVGVIVNVGPAHLEMLGSLEAIAAAKAELIAGLEPGASVIVPAGEALLEAHLREDLRVLAFGEGGEVTLREHGADGSVIVEHEGEQMAFEPSFSQRHNLLNLLAAVAVARALGLTPSGRLDVEFSAMRGQRLKLAGGAVLIDDCYNANPMSMRAAIDDLVATAPARRVAVLGDMLELGAGAPLLHREIGEYAAGAGISLLVAVGALGEELARGYGDAGEVYTAADPQSAGEILRGRLRAEDTVLVKASRGVGLERVTALLSGASVEPAATRELAPSVGPEQR